MEGQIYLSKAAPHLRETEQICSLLDWQKKHVIGFFLSSQRARCGSKLELKELFAFPLHGLVSFILLETISINELRSRWTSTAEQSIVFKV